MNGQRNSRRKINLSNYYNFARLTVMIMEAGLGIWAMPHFSYKPKSKLLVKPCQNLFEVLFSAAPSAHWVLLDPFWLLGNLCVMLEVSCFRVFSRMRLCTPDRRLLGGGTGGAGAPEVLPPVEGTQQNYTKAAYPFYTTVRLRTKQIIFTVIILSTRKIKIYTKNRLSQLQARSTSSTQQYKLSIKRFFHIRNCQYNRIIFYLLHLGLLIPLLFISVHY